MSAFSATMASIPPPSPGPTTDSRVGTIIAGKWRITDVLGRGGMGVVYAAQNTSVGKRVALKFIDASCVSEREAIARFQREAEAAASVDSPHIVHVFDAGDHQGAPYLVMEYLAGESLGARLRREGPLPFALALHIVGQCLRGLTKAHAVGVVHRDLKPDNLFLVDTDDPLPLVKILDFGISKMRQSSGNTVTTLTNRGTVMGTPHYMAPEQAQGDSGVDERADLFSVGAILFECLVGKPPFAGLASYEAIIVALCTRDAPDVRTLVPSIPESVALALKKALSRDRTQRFASATEFAEALRAGAPEVVSLARPVSSDRTPFPHKADSGQQNGPPTSTSWSSKDSPRLRSNSVPPTLPTGSDPRHPRRRWLATAGVVTALAAFGVTYTAVKLFMPTTSNANTPAAARSHSSSKGNSSARPVTMQLDVLAPFAEVWVNGAQVPTLQSKAVTGANATGSTLATITAPFGEEVSVVVRAQGYEDKEERIAITGEPFHRIALVSKNIAPAVSGPPQSDPPNEGTSAQAARSSKVPAGSPPRTNATSKTPALELKTTP